MKPDSVRAYTALFTSGAMKKASYSSHHDGVATRRAAKKPTNGKKSPTSATRGPERPDERVKDWLLLDTQAKIATTLRHRHDKSATDVAFDVKFKLVEMTSNYHTRKLNCLTK